jgi:tripartite-type tricarboxylate transporter receptor subunit TctC
VKQQSMNARKNNRYRTTANGWIASLALLSAHACTSASAADYPTAAIKLLVGFSAGGGLDISCRHWAQRLSTHLGQPVVVENRPGASGELSVKQAMASKPDGHTLVCLSGSNTISSSKPERPFDIRSDVAPVIQMTHFTFVLYVNPTRRWALARRRISHSSSSNRTWASTSCTCRSRARRKPLRP